MLSIVVCTFNGSLRIGACLESLLTQSNPPKFEIVVVDNASTDGTGDEAAKRLKRHDKDVSWKVVREEKPGLLNARIAGLHSAEYEWVLFCDDDNILFPDFLNRCGKVLSQNGDVGVLGSLGTPEFLGTKPEWFDGHSSSYAVGPQDIREKIGTLNFVYGACSVYRKNPLLDLFRKGFTPALSGRKGKEMSAGDDVEWCYLMQLAGYRIAYSDSLRFTHQLPEHRLTWDYYLKLKRGISGNAGLFEAYGLFYSDRKCSRSEFLCKYIFRALVSTLLYLKYLAKWKGNPGSPTDQLAFEILRSKKSSYLSQITLSYRHFIQLTKYFGS